MNVLIACEESGTVRDAFIRKGHNAISCDVLTTSSHGPHIIGDVKNLLKMNWDLIIAHPPCTHLSVSGAKHFVKKREDGRQREAIIFFMELLSANCNKIAVENPVNIISGRYILEHFPDLAKKYGLPIKCTQAIQPWQFGDEAQKTTCLWLKGLEILKPTNIVNKGEFYVSPSGKRLPKWYSDNKSSKVRSKTFLGIANAMAEQWGKVK